MCRASLSTASIIISYTGSPTVFPSPSLSLCFPHRLSHCVSLPGLSHCVSLPVSPAVFPSPALPLCFPPRLSHCVSLPGSPTVAGVAQAAARAGGGAARGVGAAAEAGGRRREGTQPARLGGATATLARGERRGGETPEALAGGGLRGVYPAACPCRLPQEGGERGVGCTTWHCSVGAGHPALWFSSWGRWPSTRGGMAAAAAG
jgi:hypothetical protein